MSSISIKPDDRASPSRVDEVLIVSSTKFICCVYQKAAFPSSTGCCKSQLFACRVEVRRTLAMYVGYVPGSLLPDDVETTAVFVQETYRIDPEVCQKSGALRTLSMNV
jgi:hypothetical protein